MHTYRNKEGLFPKYVQNEYRNVTLLVFTYHKDFLLLFKCTEKEINAFKGACSVFSVCMSHFDANFVSYEMFRI